MVLTAEEAKWVRASLITEIDRWEERLENKRGTNTEGVILERLSALRSVVEKVQEAKGTGAT